MGNKAFVYRATHESGAEIIGTAIELAKVIGVTSVTVSKVALEGRKVKGYIVKKIEDEEQAERVSKIDQSSWREWDRVTKPFKEASIDVRRRNLKRIYDTNKEFKDYCDRYVRNKNITLDEVLGYENTKLVADMYREKEEAEKNDA